MHNASELSVRRLARVWSVIGSFRSSLVTRRKAAESVGLGFTIGRGDGSVTLSEASVATSGIVALHKTSVLP
jgi:hypothetical protein